MSMPPSPPQVLPVTGQSIEVQSGQLAAMLGAELIGSPRVRLTGIRGLDQAQPTDLSFIRSAGFAQRWAGSRAGAALVTRGVEVPGHDPSARALLVVPDADLAMLKLLEAFAPKPVRPAPGVHPSAVVDASARIAPDARIGALCVIGPGTEVASGAVLHPRVTLGAHVRVGERTELHPGVVVYDRCEIGAECVLHANASIGADGFGFRPDPSGRGVVKVPHAGIVRIGNRVEIGAGACIDRAKFDATVIGDGTKIDNLVQIAHNCRIGRSCVICGLSGLAGSVTLGDGVTIGGSCGIADALTIGPGATLGAKSGLMHDVPAGETWLGYPAQPAREQLRTWSSVRALPDLVRKLKKFVPGLRQDESGKSR
jgi:UDP-3-O-[3-hydroxymyristoyl] glucosamine N-acyltransferase